MATPRGSLFAGCEAGILMQANPQAGTPSYSEGWGPAVEWYDGARYPKAVSRTAFPSGCYEDV